MCFDRGDLKVEFITPLFLCPYSSENERNHPYETTPDALLVRRWLTRYFMRTISPPLSLPPVGLSRAICTPMGA